MRHTCIICGTISDQRRCPTHRHNDPAATGRSSNRNNAAHLRFRKAVKQRDGHQCQDCGSTQNLRACHITPISQGGSYHPDNGITRCRTCDKATDRYAT